MRTRRITGINPIEAFLLEKFYNISERYKKLLEADREFDFCKYCKSKPACKCCSVKEKANSIWPKHEYKEVVAYEINRHFHDLMNNDISWYGESGYSIAHPEQIEENYDIVSGQMAAIYILSMSAKVYADITEEVCLSLAQDEQFRKAITNHIVSEDGFKLIGLNLLGKSAEEQTDFIYNDILDQILQTQKIYQDKNYTKIRMIARPVFDKNTKSGYLYSFNLKRVYQTIKDFYYTRSTIKDETNYQFLARNIENIVGALVIETFDNFCWVFGGERKPTKVTEPVISNTNTNTSTLLSYRKSRLEELNKIGDSKFSKIVIEKVKTITSSLQDLIRADSKCTICDLCKMKGFNKCFLCSVNEALPTVRYQGNDNMEGIAREINEHFDNLMRFGRYWYKSTDKVEVDNSRISSENGLLIISSKRAALYMLSAAIQLYKIVMGEILISIKNDEEFKGGCELPLYSNYIARKSWEIILTSMFNHFSMSYSGYIDYGYHKYTILRRTILKPSIFLKDDKSIGLSVLSFYNTRDIAEDETEIQILMHNLESIVSALVIHEIKKYCCIPGTQK